eukprot:TRINITY_DN67322_c4_g1_i10.p1 TRINITY_DN67322_c4_g1~~TRINITY_DN67322_c4_g1_i10.p1  ORF type:complete len:341 (+),score=18.51 TRINITY_DN67322_c4_g1_i10:65-1087(+)
MTEFQLKAFGVKSASDLPFAPLAQSYNDPDAEETECKPSDEDGEIPCAECMLEPQTIEITEDSMNGAEGETLQALKDVQTNLIAKSRFKVGNFHTPLCYTWPGKRKWDSVANSYEGTTGKSSKWRLALLDLGDGKYEFLGRTNTGVNQQWLEWALAITGDDFTNLDGLRRAHAQAKREAIGEVEFTEELKQKAKENRTKLQWAAQATIKGEVILGSQVVCGEPCEQRTLGTTVAPMDVTHHCNESPDVDFILPNGLAVHGAVPPLARWKQIALRSVWPDPIIQFCKVAPNAMDLESSLVLIGAEVWLVGSGWATKQADSWDTFLSGVHKWNYDDGRITMR